MVTRTDDMLLNLSEFSDEPLQGQIVRQLRAKVLAGDLPAGDALPSIRSLARQQHVSVITVQRAYETLAREGIIQARRGKGFHVSDIAEGRKRMIAAARLRESLGPIVGNALAEGLAPEEIRAALAALLGEGDKNG